MQYDLVFEGGGAKGMVLVGAYEEFVGRGHTFGRLLGTSAGAITAALVAAGYSPAEMLAALEEREDAKPVFAGFMGVPQRFTPAEVKVSSIRQLLRDINLKFVPDALEERIDDGLADFIAGHPVGRHLYAFVEHGGWYVADRFVAWMTAKLDQGSWQGGKRGFSAMTLRQFFDATKVELSLVVSDTSAARMLVLNHNTAPDCPLVWAVRMSMSIPLVWNEVIWKKEWGSYLGRDMTGHAIVDGGLLSNFPIELFISGEPQVTRLMGPKQKTAVLGMLIDESTAVAVQPPVLGLGSLVVDSRVRLGELPPAQRLMRLVDTATTAHDKMVMESYSHLVVRLPAGGYGTTEFDMSDERRAALVDAGRVAMRSYLGQPRPPVLSGAADEVSDAGRAEADRIAAKILS